MSDEQAVVDFINAMFGTKEKRTCSCKSVVGTFFTVVIPILGFIAMIASLVIYEEPSPPCSHSSVKFPDLMNMVFVAELCIMIIFIVGVWGDSDNICLQGLSVVLLFVACILCMVGGFASLDLHDRCEYEEFNVAFPWWCTTVLGIYLGIGIILGTIIVISQGDFDE